MTNKELVYTKLDNSNKLKLYSTLFKDIDKNKKFYLLLGQGSAWYYLKLKQEVSKDALILNIEDESFKSGWSGFVKEEEVFFTNFKEAENVIFTIKKVEEKFNMKFDCIIANPPYDYGNEITEAIVKNIDFDQYINLMPVSKYNKNKLYQYIIPNSLTTVPANIFKDAGAMTNPQVAILQKKKLNTTEEEFKVWCYDPTFKKFYEENLRRQHYAIDAFVINSTLPKRSPNNNTDFYCSERAAGDGVHTEASADRKWNLEKSIGLEGIPFHTSANRYGGGWIQFNTNHERDNFIEFWYKNGKEGLMTKLLWGLGAQGGDVKSALPKVDWSRSWTDEEILKDYGYTDEEIKNILQ